MASISSLMGSSSSGSIYGSRNTNIISGLASGLDTEALIEGMVQGYQQKITGLEQDRTVLQWQQEAYQSISDKLVEFARKYTSYTSDTNLFSNSFFNSAVVTTAKGAMADLVSASGKTASDVVINAVNRLATAARYTAASQLGPQSSGGQTTVSTGAVTLGEKTSVSTMDGSLTLTYGSQKVTLSFGELELYGDENGLDTDAFQAAVQEKLKEQELSIGGTVYTADQLIDVSISAQGEVTLTDKLGAGNSVSFSGASGNLAGRVTERDGGFSIAAEGAAVESVDTAEYLSDKTLSVTLNGQTKTIALDGIQPAEGESFSDAFVRALNEKLGDAFGDGKVQAALSGGQLQLTVSSTDTLSVSTTAGALLGMEDGALTSYLDTGRSLADLLGTGADGSLNGLSAAGKDAEGNALYALTINGVEVGRYTKDTSLETVLSGINNSDAGVNVSYSQLTNQFVFSAKETGAGGRIEIAAQDAEGNDNLAAALFGTVDPDSAGSAYQAGQDAEVQVPANGGPTLTLTRSSNTFDIDGMSVTVSGTFTADEAEGGVTFESKTDADTIVDAVKAMVEDYNALITEVKKAYSDMPLQQSNGSRYEPLTDEDRADMSESAIEAYEEKAKTGILFMDSDLSSLYNALRSAITPGGSDGSFLRSIGIETSYSDGLTTIQLDEQALRQALETNPDQVRDAFVKSRENGAATDGLMASIQQVTDRYAATTGAVKGILIEKAGSQYSPTAALNNTLLEQMQEIDGEIEKWQDKISNRVDYYTNQFTQLEVLINQMNAQSSALSGLMGGY